MTIGRARRDGSGVNQSFSSQGNAMNDVAVDGLPMTPTLTGTALQGSVFAGSDPFRLRVRLDGGSHPTGSLTVRIHGPGDEVCGGLPLHEQTIPVTGNGDYTAEFTPTTAGSYRWRVFYTGDDANNALHGGPCGLAGVFHRAEAAVEPESDRAVAVGGRRRAARRAGDARRAGLLRQARREGTGAGLGLLRGAAGGR